MRFLLLMFLCLPAFSLDVYGQLKNAQIENSTSDPSGSTTQWGRIWLRTDTSPDKLKYNDSGAVRDVVTTDTEQTLTNKVHSGGSVVSATLSGVSVLSTSANHVLINNSSGIVSSEGQLAITRGGTGQATAIAALSALSPLTTKGDILAHSGTTNVRIPVGNDGDVLTANSSVFGGLTYTTPATAPDQSYEIRNLTLTGSVSGNALTIAFKTKAGTDPSSGDPVKFGTRSSSATSGVYNQTSLSGATSLVISSGSTLGHASGVASYIYVYAIVNASNNIQVAASSSLYDDGTLRSTTAEGAAGTADSNSALYSVSTVSNAPIRLVGRLLVTEATAGTWASNPSEISLTPFLAQKVIAMYESNTARNIDSASAATGDWLMEDKVIDTHNAFSNSTNLFTCPVTGKYRVTVSSGSATAAWAAGELWRNQLYRAGSLTRIVGRMHSEGTNGESYVVTGSTIQDCTAGQTLEIRILQTSGGALDTDADPLTNWVIYELVDRL